MDTHIHTCTHAHTHTKQEEADTVGSYEVYVVESINLFHRKKACAYMQTLTDNSGNLVSPLSSAVDNYR